MERGLLSWRWRRSRRLKLTDFCLWPAEGRETEKERGWYRGYRVRHRERKLYIVRRFKWTDKETSATLERERERGRERKKTKLSSAVLTNEGRERENSYYLTSGEKKKNA